MAVSVIVPTRNRVHSLARLLPSLDGMMIPDAVPVEVLLVDNDSTDATWQFLVQEEAKPRPFQLKPLQEQRHGKASAVNRALRECVGDIIAIIDDDVVVHPQWLLPHLDRDARRAFDALQGRMLPGVDPDGRPANLARLFEYNIPVVDYGTEMRPINGLLATNISFTREVLDKVGLYNPALGPGASGFGEDTEYSRRIRAAGYKIGYTPHSVVYHELDPQRYGRAYNRRLHYLKGYGRSLSDQDSVLFRVLPNLLFSCLRYGLQRALGQEEQAYRSEGRLMRYWGYLAGRAGRRSGRAAGLSREAS